MIGNDIVDLHQSRIESNWQRKSWLHKLFSTQEIACITENATPEIIIWLFWSMKEAAYKIYNRTTGLVNFAPSKFCCHLNTYDGNEAKGHVTFNGLLYHTESSISNDYIHSVAKMNPLQPVCLSITELFEDIKLPDYFSLHKDNNGLPYLRNTTTHETIIASKSHHGRFQALAYPFLK